MITRGMSLYEIAEEFEKDYNRDLYPLLYGLNKDKRYYRYLLKNRDRTHVFKTIKFKSKRGNDYLIIPKTYGLSHYKKYGLETQTYLYYRIDGSDYYVVSQTSIHNTIFKDFYGYTFYTPHFFDRYQERYFKGEKMSRPELVVEYFKENSEFKSVIRPSSEEEFISSKYPNNYFCYSPQGIVLGTFIDETKTMFLASTFLTLDMLKDNQLDAIEDLKEIFKNNN